MTIIAGNTALASDFIDSSSRAGTSGDNGKVPKLEQVGGQEGKIAKEFISNNDVLIEAGEDIDAGEYVFVSDGNQKRDIVQASSNSEFEIDSSNDYRCQTFTVPDNCETLDFIAVKINTTYDGNPTGIATITLQETTAGNPNGTILDTTTLDIATNFNDYKEFDLTTTGLTSGQVISIVFDFSACTLDVSNRVAIDLSLAGLYSGGGAGTSINGTTWSITASNDIEFVAVFSLGKSKAYIYDNAIYGIKKGGVALTTTTSGSDISIQTNGIYTTSGLTIGKQYIQATAGDFGTTQSGICIGNALSSTQLELYPFEKGTTSPFISFGTIADELNSYNGLLVVKPVNFGTSDRLEVYIYPTQAHSILGSAYEEFSTNTLLGSTTSADFPITLPVQAGKWIKTISTGFTLSDVTIIPKD